MRYSQRLEAETPTRFWVNNPTPSEARRALEIGNVVGVASNGNFALRMLTHAETAPEAIALVDEILADEADDDLVVTAVSQHFLAQYCALYRPMFEESGHELGWVAIQGNPHLDENSSAIKSEAEGFFGVAENLRVKFPATVPALEALEEWSARGRATLATCGFSVPYFLDAVAAYRRGRDRGLGVAPQLYVTSLAGPLTEYLGKYVERHQLSISTEELLLAGVELAKLEYEIASSEGINDFTMLGGCRDLSHFTEMVPANMHVTVNFDFIEQLNEADPEVLDRVFDRADEAVLARLASIPPVAYALGMAGDAGVHWSNDPAALYFRNYVRRGWSSARSIVAERRILAR